jgi:hypothetical protein
MSLYATKCSGILRPHIGSPSSMIAFSTYQATGASPEDRLMMIIEGGIVREPVKAIRKVVGRATAPTPLQLSS